MKSRAIDDTPLLTAAEYARLPGEDLYRLELSRGRVVREARPGGEHGVLTGNLHVRLANHVQRHRLGRVLIETGFQLPAEPHTVRGPDIAFVSAARLPNVTPRGYWQFAPDLAVEIRSPGDRWPLLYGKVEDYLEAGTRAVWIIEPKPRTVTVYTKSNEPAVLRSGDVLRGGDILPGFRVAGG